MHLISGLKDVYLYFKMVGKKIKNKMVGKSTRKSNLPNNHTIEAHAESYFLTPKAVKKAKK